MIDDDKLKLTENHKKFAQTKIDKIRAEIVFEFVKHLRIENLAPDYFENLVRSHLENGLYPEASTLIVKFSLFSKFDLLELIVNLVIMNKIPTAKTILDH